MPVKISIQWRFVLWRHKNKNGLIGYWWRSSFRSSSFISVQEIVFTWVFSNLLSECGSNPILVREG